MLGAVALTVLLAAPAYAQTCLGSPMRQGSIALGGSAAFTDGSKSYAVGADGFSASRLAWSASVGLTDIEDVDKNATGLSASLGYVVPSSNVFSVCPFASGGYDWWSQSYFDAEAKFSVLSGGIGMGLGLDVPLEAGPTLGLFARPTLVFSRASIEITGTGFIDGDDTENDTSFGSTFGAGLNFGRAFLTGFVGISSVEESDPVFGLRLGFLVR